MATDPTSPHNDSALHTDLDFNSFILEAEQTLKIDDTPRSPLSPIKQHVSGDTTGQIGSAMETACAIFNKMDDISQGYVTHDMLRRYTKREMQAVSPTTVFNEEDFLAGFDKLDRDLDGRITLYDIVFFTR